MKPADIITIVIVITVIAAIIYPVLRKLKKRETCCGTVKEKTPHKRLKHIDGRYTLAIEGMRCSNCSRQVANAINSIDGLSAKVNLAKGEALISYEGSPHKEEAIKAIQDLDFVASPK